MKRTLARVRIGSRPVERLLLDDELWELTDEEELEPLLEKLPLLDDDRGQEVFVKSLVSSVEPDWTALAADLGRDGYVLIPGVLAASRLDLLRGFAQKIALAAKADYPDADMDVGFAPESPELQNLIDDPPAAPLLERFLGKTPTFIHAWQRVSLPHSKGGVWHQDLQREVWPPALNVAIYLDEVTELNGPTLVVPGTHVLPHPEFDRALQPRQTPVLGPAGSVAVFFATIWHRGAANSTDAPRRAFFCYYRRADAIRIRGTPDPAPGEGWGLESAD